jgi:hypothetical protein
MAWTQERLDELEKAIHSGVLKFRYSDGTEVEYRSLGQMRSLREEARAELAGSTKRRRVTILSGSSGLR